MRKFACCLGPHRKFKDMTVCLYAEEFQHILNRPPKLFKYDLSAWMHETMEFKREVEDFISWTDKTTATQEDWEVTKTVTRTYLMEDGETLVLHQSETRDFKNKNVTEIYDPREVTYISDVLTEFDPCKLPTEQSQKMDLNLAEHSKLLNTEIMQALECSVVSDVETIPPNKKERDGMVHHVKNSYDKKIEESVINDKLKKKEERKDQKLKNRRAIKLERNVKDTFLEILDAAALEGLEESDIQS